MHLLAVAIGTLVGMNIDLCAQSVSTANPDRSGRSRATTLIVDSEPSSASITLDSVAIATTPKTFSPIEARRHSISIRKAGFAPFWCEVNLVPDDTIIIKAKLMRLSGTLTVVSNRDKATIAIDGRDVGTGGVDSLTVEFGRHTILVLDPAYGKELHSSFAVEGSRHMTVAATFNVFSFGRLFGGVLLPGSRQLADGDYLKGTFLVLAGIGSLGNFVSSFTSYTSAENDYRSALDEYDRASTEPGAQQLRNIADRRGDEYQVVKRRLNLSIEIMCAVWLANTIDIILHHFLTDQIEVFAHPGFPQTDKDKQFADCYVGFAVRLP